MKKTFKVICYTMLSIILSGVISAAAMLLPAAASDHVHEYEYGVCDCGDVESTYTKIYTKDDLDRVRKGLGGKYVLMNDILFTAEDFSQGGAFYNNGAGWLPIGCDFDGIAYYYEFYGVFNGNGHSIQNLVMDRTPTRQSAYPANTTASYGNASITYYTPHAFGLFAINDGVIANLDLSVDYTVNANPYAVVGAIAGVNSGLITDCSTVGSIYAIKDISSGDSDFGGIAGWLANGTVTKCHSDVDLGGKNESPYPYLNFGGIVGATAGVGKCSISLSFNTGNIYPDSKSGGYLGGIVGRASCATYQNGFSLLISDCYNTGFIGKADYVGRVAGICAEYYGSMDLKIERCYSVGDLGEKRVTAGILQTSITSDRTHVESSYYLASTADAYMCNYNTGTLVDGYALELKEMRIEDSYVGFDFENTWIIVGNSGYQFPQLRENTHTETDHKKHTFNEYTETEPTCKTEGVHRKICTECGYFVDSIIPTTPHDYSVTVYPVTCEEDGYTRYVCKICEQEYSDNFIKATGHTLSVFSVTDPTCEGEGYTTYRCDCGYTVNDDERAATGHNYRPTVYPPSCTESGYTQYACSNCGGKYTENVVDPLGHSHSATVTAPTCTNPGYTTYTCHCGDSFTGNDTAALGHTHTVESSTPPTCTSEGITVYVCHCGDTYTIPTEATGHSYSATVTEPDCINPGFTTYTCHCGESYVASITTALGHTHTPSVTDPDCVNPGYTTYTCHCGDSYIGAITSPTGHSYSPTVTVPDCINPGFTTYTCHCGESYDGDALPAKGHSYDENGICTKCKESDPDFDTGADDDTVPDDNAPGTNPDGGNENGGSGAVTKPDGNENQSDGTVDGTCTCYCHRSGFLGFLFKIINFFNRLFGLNPTCRCGAAHYIRHD